jgi:protein-S-isoprenylcysteine O-methyltransferase Ste14
MVILFADVIIIRSKFREAFARIRLAPDWVFYLCAIFGLVASAFGVYVTFTNPWITQLNKFQWDMWIGGIGVLSLLVGAVLFFVGQATIKSNVSDEEVIAEVTQ